MNRCEACKWWTRDQTKGLLRNEILREFFLSWGECQQLPHHDMMEAYTNMTHVKTGYQEDIHAETVETNKDFGCVLWEGSE